MKRNPIRILLLTVLLSELAMSAASTQMIISQPRAKSSSCSGSLVILTPVRGERKFHDSKTNTLLQAESVHIEGCGCYYLYKRPGFKATSRLITPSMGSVTGDTIGFKIRSIERVHCEEAVV